MLYKKLVTNAGVWLHGYDTEHDDVCWCLMD
jgi:hypothetical protein